MRFERRLMIWKVAAPALPAGQRSEHVGLSRCIILTTMPLLTAAALGGPAPAPVPAATAPPAPAATMPVADPVRQLRAANSTPAQRDEAARRLILQQNEASRRVLLETLGDASNSRAQLA